MSRGGRTLVAGLATAGLLLAGCSTTATQSAVHPAGPAARAIDGHTTTMLWIASIVWVLVVVGLLAALVRRNRPERPEGRRAPMFVAVAGAVVPAAILVGVMVQSVLVLRETDPTSTGSGEAVEVEGRQYWWEVRYPEHGVVTANEIHIPTGERVELQLTSDDVIHSLWVPQLGGKVDMVPGEANSMWLQADEPGTYWGQCAEYCGLQHAQMRFIVVAHEPAEFDGWVRAQAEPARDPAAAPGAPDGETVPDSDLVARGREVFMSSSCVYCHAVAGTEARARVGPDLTHLASRQTLAAGVLENNPGNLAAWVVDPQSIKPGNLMPGTDLGGEELEALLAYLQSLE